MVFANHVYFNAQYHDQLTFNYLSQLQELYDVDFIGFSLLKQILQKFPDFIDRIVVHDLTDYELKVLRGTKSTFSSTFENGALKELFKTINLRFLGDYIFLDSVTINNSYADRYNFRARFEEGYGEEFQTVLSSLKLGEFDLLRILNGQWSRILSYLNRDIRNQTIKRENAKDILDVYLNKEWKLSGLAEFLEFSETNIHDLFYILMKKSGMHHTFKKTSNASPIYNHSQLIM